jgi:hypothetical protein
LTYISTNHGELSSNDTADIRTEYHHGEGETTAKGEIRFIRGSMIIKIRSEGKDTHLIHFPMIDFKV